jgi:hypothetical protein
VYRMTRAGAIEGSRPLDWSMAAESAIAKAANARLRLEVRGTKASFVVDGLKIGEFALDSPLAPEIFGPFIANKQAVVYRYILLIKR